MSCNICEDDFGHKYCSCCTYRLCHTCANKIANYKCPQCKQCMKVKYFMAGKIEPLKLDNRVLVFSGDDESYEKIIEGLVETDKYFYYRECNQKGIDNSMKLEEFKNLSIPMKQVEENNHILVGPCAILNKSVVVEGLNSGKFCHGYCSDVSLLHSVEGITQTLNKRNKEMIEKCDVFCLAVDTKRSCYRSFAEWGIALALGKVLIIDIADRALHPELYLYAQDSLDSFEKLPYDRRDVIIKSCPINKIGSYAQYKKGLLYCINLKNGGGYAFESETDDD